MPTFENFSFFTASSILKGKTYFARSEVTNFTESLLLKIYIFKSAVDHKVSYIIPIHTQYFRFTAQSTLCNYNRLFHSLFWIELKRSVGVKGFTIYCLTLSIIFQLLASLSLDFCPQTVKYHKYKSIVQMPKIF